jgi:zona occludens toxin (predicted ATPase)
MAIKIVDGIPRSGKSFYAVRHFAKNFCDFIEDDYYLKDGVTVLSNVDGLKLPHIKFQDLIRDAKLSVNQFFSYDYQEKVVFPTYGPVVYIIDEAQVLWRKNDRSKEIDEVYHWFELHGHFGQDIYLITQSYKKLPPDISIMPEFIIHAVPRTRSMTGEFRYKQISEGEVQDRFGIRPDPKIFALYKSSSAKETEKIRNPMMRTIGLMVFAVVLLASGSWWFVMNRLNPEPIAKKQIQPSGSSSSSSPSISIAKSSPLVSPSSEPILIPINTISLYSGTVERVSVVFNNTFVSIDSFPYPIVKKGKNFFVSVDPSLAYLFISSPDKLDENKPADRQNVNDTEKIAFN